MAMSSPRDSISSFPDEILGKILSLLPTKVAASTSILSKRWRNLLGLVDTLSFDESMVVYPNEEEAKSGSNRFLEFVDKTVASLLSNSQIKKFSLSRAYDIFGDSDGSDVNYEYDRVNGLIKRWILTAMECGLLELHLQAIPCTSVHIETEFLTSKTLVKLTISGEYSLEVERIFFPVLKSLSLLSVSGIDHPNYCRLIDGCPVLEELYIRDGDNWRQPPGCCRDVQSASIKRLVVFTNLPKYQEDHDLVYFEAPNLVYLDYSSYVSELYQFVDLDSLVEARLSLRLWESTTKYDYSDDDDDNNDDDYDYDYDDDDDDDDVDDDEDDDDDDYDDEDDDDVYDEPYELIFGDVTKLVAGITNITTLRLSPDSLEAFHFCCRSMPMFHNLLNLFIESNKEKGWQVMPLLLKSCPILQKFVIKGLVHRVTNRCGDACACIPKKQRKIVKEEELCCLWTCQVKVLEISEYGGSFQELEQMRHFLGKLECLETVKVGVDADNDNRSEFLRDNLLNLPRVSTKCNIHFI